MKKLFIASVCIFMSLTSCTNVLESAYIAECSYRCCKKGIIEPSDSTKYKEEFMSIYMRMDKTQRHNYAIYRKEQMQIEKRVNNEYKKAENTANSYLNE